MTPPRPSLFDYDDFRSFLKDWYRRKREEEQQLSYRRLAADIGFKSPGHFSLIVNGKANLSLKILDRFIRYLDLSKKESDYFQALVLFNQAKAHVEKRRHFEKLLSFRSFRVRSLGSNQYEFLDQWYYLAVREALEIHPFRGDYKALGQWIEPPIGAEEARKAVETLKRLGMITKDAQGRYHRVDAVLEAGPDAPALSVNGFLLQALDLAKQAIDNIPKEERLLSATTVSVSRQTFEEIREEVRAFRKRILEAAQRDPSPERIYQFQFHVIPLSKPAAPGGRP